MHYIISKGTLTILLMFSILKRCCQTKPTNCLSIGQRCRSLDAEMASLGGGKRWWSQTTSTKCWRKKQRLSVKIILFIFCTFYILLTYFCNVHIFLLHSSILLYLFHTVIIIDTFEFEIQDNTIQLWLFLFLYGRAT